VGCSNGGVEGEHNKRVTEKKRGKKFADVFQGGQKYSVGPHHVVELYFREGERRRTGNRFPERIGEGH
jgi:hypothetical protein